ncbi:Lar family restriction alleviation protein [Xenorhabdus griffiniae]|uniref:Lar family restriction alleviation protein n=1 Tax=Xenorhabdus griffiniae TaxID=351672 RepID=UPI002359F163|nr:Lar family restriction alleviation protein [Xenorhabdus griffiniae]MDC9607190.1 Lar family restriction alleviation protein [Xenorhabdus griffiniae]
MTDKLKSCPFCGSDDLCPDYEDRDSLFASWINCGNCGTDGPLSKWEDSYAAAESAAIQAWNQRANDDEGCN